MMSLAKHDSSEFYGIDELVSTQNQAKLLSPHPPILAKRKSNSLTNLLTLKDEEKWENFATYKNGLYKKQRAECTMLACSQGDEAIITQSSSNILNAISPFIQIHSNPFTKEQIRQFTLMKECVEDIKFYLALPPKPPLLPKNNKKVLALDLDNTLLYNVPLTMKLTIKTYTACFQNGDRARIAFRPFLNQFLITLSKSYRIVIFTSSDRSYAEPVVRIIDPNKEIFCLELYRFHCVSMKGKFFMKNLQLLGDLSSVILVDNLLTSFALQLDNGICIKEFKGDAEDTELQWLLSYLVMISESPDVRLELIKTFLYTEKLNEILKDQAY
jgi:Dullard-like phosphatase family protein